MNVYKKVRINHAPVDRARNVYVITDEVDRLKEARALLSEVEYQAGGEREVWERAVADLSHLIDRRTRELDTMHNMPAKRRGSAEVAAASSAGAVYGLPDVNVRPLSLPSHLLLPLGSQGAPVEVRGGYDTDLAWSDERRG